jgi:hypothetical protein
LKAWKEITSTTVINGWKHTGILPSASSSDCKMEQIPQLQTAELELQNALTQLVTSKCLTQRSVASVLDMLDVEAEKETENKWTIQELIDEHKLDLCEAFSEQIEEPEPKPERKPHMTWSEASSTVTLLLHLLHTENGDMPEEA